MELTGFGAELFKEKRHPIGRIIGGLLFAGRIDNNSAIGYGHRAAQDRRGHLFRKHDCIIRVGRQEYLRFCHIRGEDNFIEPRTRRPENSILFCWLQASMQC